MVLNMVDQLGPSSCVRIQDTFRKMDLFPPPNKKLGRQIVNTRKASALACLLLSDPN